MGNHGNDLFDETRKYGLPYHAIKIRRRMKPTPSYLLRSPPRLAQKGRSQRTGTTRSYVMTLSELLDAAAAFHADEESQRRLLTAASETLADFRGQSLVLAMINAGTPTVLEAVAGNFNMILDDVDLASQAFAILEQGGHLEQLRPAVGKYIRSEFDLLMEDQGDPWGNIAIDRYAKSLAAGIGCLPGVLREEALKVLHTEASQRGIDTWQATTASWLEQRTLEMLGERR
jgi:hypothetical protein